MEVEKEQERTEQSLHEAFPFVSDVSKLATQHPAYPLLFQEKEEVMIEQEVLRSKENDLSFVKSVEFVTQLHGFNIGEGWVWRLVFSPNYKSHYFGHTLNVIVKIGESYPVTMPQVIWFESLITHCQIDTAQFLVPPYDKQLLRVWDADPSPGLGTIVNFVNSIFHEPLREEISRAALINMWSKHDEKCTCEMVPIPYSKLKTFSKDKIKVEINKMRDRYNELIVPLNFAQHAEASQRRIEIINKYQPKHPELFDIQTGWNPKWFCKEFREAIQDGSPEALSSLFTEVCAGVFAFDVFTPKFCDLLASELANYETSPLPKSRPNSMNNYGIILNDIGMEGMMTLLLQKYFQPLSSLLFPQFGGSTVDHHHTFMVHYEPNKDRDLDMHIDDSEVTVNINLVDEFTGAGLAFCGLFYNKEHREHSTTYEHKKGRGIIHAGAHRHGALSIRAGVRKNFIMWMRSSSYRLSRPPYLRKDADVQPDKICLSRTHDKDYDHWSALLK
eukprot:CAMPEP_0174261948 /NCGR_PEP_ID=MMETSP0439-20130205/12686_1 /TAXON_ID=0 /ORGANISM="Stereomyxa ramosa, Strain Chinc5" /LENGTH=500 /DNA_ID=CAMNT_0015346569 /DNA_START=24 /DNA_END=1526 /DNA_ORIENTATION=-